MSDDDTDNASVRLLGRDRTPFLPAVVWRGGTERIDVRENPAAWHRAAAADVHLVTQWDDGAESGAGVASCAASMPTVVRQMLDACDVREGHRVLEVGTGTGFTAALLKDRVGPLGTVTTVEIDRELAAEADARLKDQGVDVEVLNADGFAGWAAGAPYDRVHVTCAVRAVPSAWLSQCPGGLVMLPWGTSFSGNDHVVALEVENGVATGRFGPGVSFMYLRSQRAARWPEDWPDVGEPVGIGVPWQEVDGPLRGFGEFVVGLRLPGVRHLLVDDDDVQGLRTLWLNRGESYAALGFGEHHPTTVAGDQELANAYLDAAHWWYDHGRPEAQGFGLRVVADGDYARQHVWFGSPDGPTWPLDSP